MSIIYCHECDEHIDTDYDTHDVHDKVYYNAKELLARLTYCHLTAGSWNDELFIGNAQAWDNVNKALGKKFKHIQI
jgi:hypothetical protein